MRKPIFILLFLFPALLSHAQVNPYHYRKASLYETLGIKSHNIVFLGNSITDFNNWDELFENKNIVNRGIRLDKTEDVLSRLNNIVEGKPQKVFLMIGIDDLAAGIEPETIIENIGKIIDRFKKESPATQIYMQSILPVNEDFAGLGKNYRGNRGKILEVNESLRDMCEKRGLVYINLYDAMSDGNDKLKPNFTNDGLHLMGEAYLAWKNVVKQYLK